MRTNDHNPGDKTNGATPPTAPPQNAGPVFLVGALRSGTTMLRLMLDGHPDLRVPFEFDFAVDAIGEDGRYPSVPAYLEHLATHRIFLATGLQSDPELSYRELVNSYLEQARVKAGKPRVGATLHRHFEYLPQLWPNARYLHLLRDGRDVARSVIRMGWAGNAYVAANVWLEAERSWDRLCTQVPADRRMEVRYEALVREPEQMLREVCAFLEITYDPDMLEYHKRSTYGRPTPKAAANWQKDAATRKEGLLAEAKLRTMLQMRGYPLSSEGPDAPIAPHRDLLLRADSRLKAFAFRAKRMGPQLTAMDMVTRRFPVPKQFRQAVQRQINAVELQHLK